MGLLIFHQLDLPSIKVAKGTADEFTKLRDRLDIVVANAGISMVSLAELSEDGYEKLFATDHLGHSAFMIGLLGKYNISVPYHCLKGRISKPMVFTGLVQSTFNQ